MVGRKGREDDTEELRVNGFGRGYSIFALALQSVGIALAIAMMIAIASEWRRIVVFMGAGDRCTSGQCSAIDSRLALLEARVANLPPDDLIEDLRDVKIEDRRLQRQIDRIEEHVFFGIRKPPLPPYVEE